MAYPLPTSDSSNFRLLPDSLRALPANAKPVGPVNRDQVESLTIRSRSRAEPGELEALVREMYEKPLSERKYLSKQEVCEKFGARSDDLHSLEELAGVHKLQVVSRSVAERSVVVKGPLGNLLDALPADLQIVEGPDGERYRGRQGEIAVPTAFAQIITGVFGYDTRPVYRPRRVPGLTAHAGPGGALGQTADVFAERYNFPKDLNGIKLDGTGQCVAMIELEGGYVDADLDAFFRGINVRRPQVVAVSVNGATNAPVVGSLADIEVMLDIEVVGTIVPGATLAVYFTPRSDQGYVNALSRAVHDTERNPSVISLSWGAPEQKRTLQSRKDFHDVFLAAAVQGITVCAASGDHGVADVDFFRWEHTINVDHPASDNLVLACGGTQIDVPTGADHVWHVDENFDADTPGGGGRATGGGISQFFDVPLYQEEIRSKMPASIDPLARDSTGGVLPGRGVPDIAMCAVGHFTRIHGTDEPHSGTSAVSPLMAGLVARLNQATGKNVGFLNPFFYKNPGLFRPVTQGHNGVGRDPRVVPGYSAGPGWNACAGLGTPDGVAILNALRADAAPPTPPATPVTE